MRKKTSRGAREQSRESLLASGWTVEADPGETAAAELAGDPERPATDGTATDGASAADAVGAAPLDDAAGGREADADPGSDEAAPQLSNAMLMVLGVLGGLYLLYAWIWLSWTRIYAAASADLAASSGSLGAALQQTVLWFAPLAPLLWFVAALLLTRRAERGGPSDGEPQRGLRSGRLLVWLLIGAVLLLPLPVFGWAGGN